MRRNKLTLCQPINKLTNNNLKGVLYFWNTPLLDFEIKNHELIKAIDLNDGKLFPWELAQFGVTYGNINAFFERRTMKEGCMFYREHLKAIGMDKFDFDKYIMLNNGNNNLDNYWVIYMFIYTVRIYGI